MMTVNAIGDGFFTQVFCDDKSKVETTSKYSMFMDSGKLEIQIPNKYQLTMISPEYASGVDVYRYSIYNNPSRLSMSLRDIACCKYVTCLDVSGFNCHGDLSNLSELTNLIELYIGDGVYGDIMSLKACKNLKYLHLNSPNITGNLNQLINEWGGGVIW